MQSLKKYNANTNAFPVGGQLNKAENVSLTKRQIAEEMQPHFFMGTEMLPREYKIKSVTSAILTVA